MPICYYDLGSHKQLHEIVFAGSHDAGINAGDSNVRTQTLDIQNQALAGVRIFDLRIAAANSGRTNGQKTAELRSFHADGLLQSKKTVMRQVSDVNRSEAIQKTHLRGGAFGMSLSKILLDAAGFVKTYSKEFLILKFDKSTNWPLIAEACCDLLSVCIYTGGGNLNTKTLKDLRGKVVVLFTSDGLQAVTGRYDWQDGILGIKNLYSGGTYDTSYNGLQYFGKGGTSVVSPFAKLGQNVKKQKKILSSDKPTGQNPDIIGMMYWTTTGMFESIGKRNSSMWSAPNVAKLKSLWKGGMRDAVQSRLPNNVNGGSASGAATLKKFIPNIVMIDFADSTKCKTIYDLNKTSQLILAGMAGADDDDA